MNRIKNIPFLLVLVILILAISTLFISDGMRYKEITQGLEPIGVEDLKDIDKKTGAIFIGSSNCEDCLTSINKVYVTMKKEKGSMYYIDCNSLQEAEVSLLMKRFGVKEIPSILVFQGQKVRIIGPEELGVEK